MQNRNVSIVGRLRYFESVVSSVACFAGGHRAMYTCHLERLDHSSPEIVQVNCRPSAWQRLDMSMA